MKKILILIISLFFNFNYVYSADYKIGNKLKMVSADGFTKANTGEKIYSKDNTLKIEGDWSERFVLGHGDCGSDTTWSDCKSDRSRVEQKENYSKTRNKWYRFSFFIPENYPSKARGIKTIQQMIAQVKASDSREPIWSLGLFQEGGDPYRFQTSGLNLKFGLANNDHRVVTCRNILSWEEMLGKWNEITIFVNYSKKTTDWLTVDGKEYYAGLWLNEKRMKLQCAEKKNMPNGILGEYDYLFNKKGSHFSYGIYLTRVGEYLLSEMNALGMCEEKNESCGLNIQWKKDKGGHGMKSTKYIQNWTKVKWPIKLETRKVWFDNQAKKSSKKNIWNMPLKIAIDKSSNIKNSKFLAIVVSKSNPSVKFTAEGDTKGKANVKAMRKCFEKHDDCSLDSSRIIN